MTEQTGRIEGIVERTSVLGASLSPDLAAALDAEVGAEEIPGMAPLARWEAHGDGVSLVHRVPRDAVPLAQVRDEGPWRLGAAAALGRQLVAPVRALHASGRAHGALGLDTVLLTPDGLAVLGGIGLGWAVVPGRIGGPGSADDVAALAGLVRRLVGAAPVPAALVLVLLRCGDDDPGLRPSLDDLDRALGGCLLAGDHAEPVERPVPALGARPLVGEGGPDPETSFLDRPAVLRPVRPRRRASRRRWPLLVAGLAVAGLALRAALVPAIASDPAPPAVVEVGPMPAAAASTATQSGAGSPVDRPGPDRTTPAPVSGDAAPAPPQSSSGTPGVRHWAQVVAALDAVRLGAIQAGSRERLALAVDPAGPAWAADASLAERVRSRGVRLTGGRLEIVRAELISSSEGSIELRVVDRRSAYTVAAAGRTVQVPARAPAAWIVRLVRGADGSWLLHAVRPRP